GGREPRGRSTQSARAELQRSLERRSEERGNLESHLGDPADRGRLLPPAGHPRPAPRGRERRALRWLADDPLGSEDVARDRRAPHDAGIAAVRDACVLTVTPSKPAGCRVGGLPALTC